MIEPWRWTKYFPPFCRKLHFWDTAYKSTQKVLCNMPAIRCRKTKHIQRQFTNNLCSAFGSSRSNWVLHKTLIPIYYVWRHNPPPPTPPPPPQHQRALDKENHTIPFQIEALKSYKYFYHHRFIRYIMDIWFHLNVLFYDTRERERMEWENISTEHEHRALLRL